MGSAYEELPEQAQRLLGAIARALDEARPLLANAPANVAYTMRETESRYVPDVVAAYTAVPRSQRSVATGDKPSADDLLLRELSTLHRAVTRDLERLAEEQLRTLSAHQRFLSQRFDDRSDAIDVPQGDDPAFAVSAARWFSSEQARTPQETVAEAARRLREAFPQFVEVRNTGVFGMGAPRAVEVTLPAGNGVTFRFTLADVSGRLEATVAKLVHGTTIQTISCSSVEWLEALHDELAEIVRRNQQMSEPFARLFSETGRSI